jgi:hypothetical protein
MKKHTACAAALAGLIGSALLGSTAEASPTTVNFSFLNGSTTVADGALTYLNPGPITAFSGFSAFNITFHGGALTDSYTLSQLIGLPAMNQFVDFDTSLNQFAFAPDPYLFGVPMALAANNGSTITFYIYNLSGIAATDNALNMFGAPITNVNYRVSFPEPASVALFGGGMLGLGLLGRRRRKS